MTVLINGEKVQQPTPRSMSALVDLVLNSPPANQGWVINEVLVDGESITLNDIEQHGDDIELSEDSKVEFRLQSPRELMLKSIQDGITAGGELLNGILNLANQFRMGETNEALNEMPQWTEELRVYLTYVSEMKQLVESLGFPRFYADLPQDQLKWLDTLKELVDAQTNADWVLVADLFEYEIAESIQTCLKRLQEGMDFLGDR